MKTKIINLTKHLALTTLSAILISAASAKEGAVQCANLIYAGTKTSECFSDEFLTTVQQKTSITTERRFKAVKMSSDELFKFPFVIMTGTGDFSLTTKERENLKKYLNNGGFLLASPSCSDETWATAFSREIKRIFDKDTLKDIPQDHALFKTIFTIKELKCKSGKTSTLQGITLNDKLVVCYTADGLNDTPNTEGCCC
ncbi:MAG: DUF4159 domain-containing protein [Akkermansiaceae bacterium]